MHPKYPNVFSEFALGPVKLRNRFYSSPHGMPMSLNGRPTDDYLHYNVARAEGGLGLIMLSLTIPERSAGAQSRPNVREFIPAFRAVADAVHGAGAKIFGETFYQWCATARWQPFAPSAPILAPSVSQYSFLDRRSATRAMNKREIDEMRKATREAVENLREAGFDGIMLHASHGALLEQFLSPYYNRRSDEYGGSLENRMRLLVESLKIAREAAGPDMAVGMRFNCDEMLAGGYGTGEAREALKSIADRGLIDFVDLDIAVEPDQFHLGMPPVFVEPQVYRPYVEAVRSAAGKVPVLSVLGRMTSVADAEAVLASGVCDMIGAARAFIAEPELVRNAYEGREERSRRCIACNECMAGMLDGGGQGCAINPASYRERMWGHGSFAPAPAACKVVVVGGGPAGLEAARASALRGHQVVLIERRERLGGALALWADLPGREFYRHAIDWWDRENRRLGVDIRLNTCAAAADILAEQADAVILATGAHYSAEGRSNFVDQPIEGYDRDFVRTPEDVLLGPPIAGKVVVLDAEGLNTGVGTAEYLARRGSKVEFLTPGFSPVSVRLVDSQDAPFIMKRLHEAGVRISPSTYVKSIEVGRMRVYDVHSLEERMIEDVAAVVLSTGRMPANELEQELDGKVGQFFVIGDALAPRFLSNASYEGQKFARLIGEPGAARSIDDVYFAPDEPYTMPFPADVGR
jgi:2,4-dienoyl-CoA reductase-like NADH-dependent reductase (Old Yellow Enzyme family)/pyruvate/2-oxoglutarate dehydrogenase complex dihydrolipoamide dehydrogenase (E3) component